MSGRYCSAQSGGLSENSEGQQGLGVFNGYSLSHPYIADVGCGFVEVCKTGKESSKWLKICLFVLYLNNQMYTYLSLVPMGF